MIRYDITIGNKYGLHARAAAKLVALTSRHAARITLGHAAQDTQQHADAKNIMAMLMLAASQGTSLVIICDGDDEEELLAAVCALIDDRFGEEE